ncbi:MAG TPA: serine hydrolase domain-containing protein [Myxococcaceae bacterium]|nr:serine hydrolase domain-containing protein [Myxococcaceae bacterium]
MIRRASIGLLWVFVFPLDVIAAMPVDPELARAVDAYIAPYVPLRAFSGVALIAKGESILLEKAWGFANEEFQVPNTPDTRFRIASITKRFTLIVVTRLVQEKKLALTDHLAKFAPSFPKADAITIDHLLNHRSGIRDPDNLRRIISMSYTPSEVVEILAKLPLGSEPGTTFSYTTANYAVLAFIIEKVTGRTFAEVVRKYVYEPARMTDTGDLTTVAVVPKLASAYMPNPFGGGAAMNGPEDCSWKAGGGSGYATARDLYRFLRAYYGKKLLPSLDPVSLFQHGEMFGKRVSESSGSFPGANASMIYFPDEELAVVVLSNSYAAVAGTIAKDLAAIALKKPFPKRAADSPGTRPIDPKLFGPWAVEGFPNPLTIETRHGHAIASWSGVRQNALLRTDDNTYFLPLDWATLTFSPAPDGTVEGMLTAPWSDKPRKLIRK